MLLSVIIPTHNPHLGRLTRTLQSVRLQTLSSGLWECIIVDNASQPPLHPEAFPAVQTENLKIVRELQLGLASARRRGFMEAKGDYLVLVDDDNVLASDYLEQTVGLFVKNPRLGAIGGKSYPEFESTPPKWVREFDNLIACRDLGTKQQLSDGLLNHVIGRNVYPAFAPIGAGMALRSSAASAWLTYATGEMTDRRGDELTSGGDNDIILCVMQAGWEVGYSPSLSLIHLIPNERTTRRYLARLNRGIQKSWMQVLTIHNANPFPPLTWAGAFLRVIKAYITYRAWASPESYIRWQGARGHFEGRASKQNS